MTASSAPLPRILAGIDIGTLTCRLLIAELLPSGSLREIQSERKILRLGQGVDRDRTLHPDAMARVIPTLKQWCQAIERAQVEAAVAVATSAVRDAANRDEFVNLVRRETGLAVEVISGEEEARRTLLGIRSGLPKGVTDMLALDIGGGSTELILDRPGRSPLVRSVDIGVVRLCERVLQHDPPTSEEVEQAREWAARETRAAVLEMEGYRAAVFVGTAGTITALAAMAQQLSAYEPARIHNYRLMRTEVQALEATLLSRTKSGRVGLPGLERNREDVIAAGAIILRTVMDTLGVTTVLVSDYGLREGVLLDLARQTA
ncbi:MAG: Ppx/GppA family phosphatase [Nitrospiraceae bacterium]|nr:Ppx/GppA family phosphatase [Nitrospiraceae bacterium]